ncbi:MAG TPA: dTDP-4-dehydrorhamnose 3,5-epimerase [Phycisphaerales bacterium]|nr:dTDP-4-dehydrorhamnose 3,5-epimerase [Phycisphaerales bacterium]
MNIIETDLPGVIIFEPKVFSDSRGSFIETWSKQRYEDAGINAAFVQDNVSYSTRGVLRGLHYQHPHQQGKLIQVLKGEVFDVAVDIRLDSATFGKWASAIISEDNHRQIYIPPGFAHGFCVLSDEAVFSYKCTDYYNGPCEGGIRWDDPDIAIDWPIPGPSVSPKDATLANLSEISEDKLPRTEDI